MSGWTSLSLVGNHVAREEDPDVDVFSGQRFGRRAVAERCQQVEHVARGLNDRSLAQQSRERLDAADKK